MNITKFKAGDIITRNEAGGFKKEDGSWCGNRIILRGVDETAKIIFFEVTSGLLGGDILDLSYARDSWDEGWCYYPETLWQKIKKVLPNTRQPSLPQS